MFNFKNKLQDIKSWKNYSQFKEEIQNTIDNYNGCVYAGLIHGVPPINFVKTYTDPDVNKVDESVAMAERITIEVETVGELVSVEELLNLKNLLGADQIFIRTDNEDFAVLVSIEFDFSENN